jgi:hypothetical protein
LETPIKRAPFFFQRDQRAPAIKVAASARHRPMDQIKVNVIEAQAPQAFVASAQRFIVSMLAVPQFCGDENFFARHARIVQPFADASFVAVNSGGVDQAIAYCERSGNSGGGFFIRGLPSAESELRNG